MDLELHTKQALAFQSNANEILYGGAAGGGKSYLMRIASIVWSSEIAGLQVYLFRRVRDDLHKNHMEGPKGYRNVLREWIEKGLVEIAGDEIRFWNGSMIYLCHCKDERDRFKYQGAEIHVLLIDELTHFTERVYRFLRGRVRNVGIDIPEKYNGVFPRILCGSNPGNVGHNWVKASFIDCAVPLEIRRMSDAEGGMRRQFIPARLDDNPSMTEDDPLYRSRLRGLGSAALVKAMEDGDWNVVEGAYFDCWRTEIHVIEPFKIPDHWIRARSFDWGSAKPFSVGWWTVANEEFTTSYGLYIQKGCLIRYREWYGAKSDDVGLKMTAEAVGRGIRERESGEKIAYGVADPSIGKEDGGPSIRERMGISFRMGDNRRVTGWDNLRQRLKGDENGPMILCFKTCAASIRTIPSLQHDDKRPEDLDTAMEDHCFAAGTLVKTPMGSVPIESLPESGLVLSAGGRYEKYRSARLVKTNADVVSLRFSNNVNVVCTGDHRFLVGPDEWRYAIDLKGNEVICSQSSLAEQFKSLMESGIIYVGNIFKKKVFACIGRYGNIIMVASRKGAIFTMQTETIPTIQYQTLSACPSESIFQEGMERQAALMAVSQLQRQLQQQPYGMAAPKAENGTLSTLKKISGMLWKKGLTLFAKNAARHIKSVQSRLNKANTVGQTAKRVHCVSVEKMKEKADVYCITVPSTGMFAIDGGILVSNCADEWRYMVMSRPWTRRLEVPKPPIDAPVTYDQAIKSAEKTEKRKRL